MYTVVWSDEALEGLVNLWTDADPDLQPLITAAVHRIDENLADDPENAGESRDDGNRVWFEFPLAVLFSINSNEKTVHIGRVWTFRKRS
jgi:hypothetical protein